MAKIKAGILSKVSGKVAGVVGATWKGQNYLRELVKPSNPNTALQQAQRGLMSAVVKCARNYSGDVFKPYLDKFLKNMSGYNWFVKENIKKFNGTDNALTSALVFAFGNGQACKALLNDNGGAYPLVSLADTAFTVPAGTTITCVAVAWNDTKGQALVAAKTENGSGTADTVLDAPSEYGWSASDKVSVGAFYAYLDSNGVVQALSPSIQAFITIS
ncbi:DUF6266 family protein [Fibrobacter sp.]|uniref:DUF6266 family protein n=1 Tax=Fibrobacter sp. TaxID=35828 RepID=UPI0025B9375C|nr:DUF6266 family protein [Fibrobacter sp.]MBR4008503.1 hypothetical protein [Fibrobacter sp.]